MSSKISRDTRGSVMSCLVCIWQLQVPKRKFSVGVFSAGLSNLFDDYVSEPSGILLRRLQLFYQFLLGDIFDFDFLV